MCGCRSVQASVEVVAGAAGAATCKNQSIPSSADVGCAGLGPGRAGRGPAWVRVLIALVNNWFLPRHFHITMVFALASRALRTPAARPILSQLAGARRGYAEAVSEQLKLSFVLPHSALYNNQEVTQVNIPAVSGDIGILAAHVPTVEQIRPGLLEVIESTGTSKKFFGMCKSLMFSLERLCCNPP